MRLSVKTFGVILIITIVLIVPLIFVRSLLVLGDYWSTTALVPKAVAGHGMATIDEKICAIGGTDYDVWVVNNTWWYDSASDTWTYGASIPATVTYAASGVTTDTLAPKLIYFIGGRQDLDAVNLTQVYDPETDSWTTGAPIPTTRGRFGIALINDNL